MTTTYKAGTLVHVAPTDLLLQRNIREATPSADLIKSIRAVGVLEPITAVATTDGLLVRTGHRRTLAAVEANAKTVPVYVSGDDDTTDAGEIDRIVAQRDENTHRTGLTTAEEVGVVEQLAAFGLSPAQIAKKARIKRNDVTAAIAVAESDLARKATAKYDQLTLDQAAVVAEFEEDPETVKTLVVAAHEGRFEHAAQRARDTRDEAQARNRVLEDLEAAGVTVVERPGYDDKKTLPLTRLVSTDGGDRLDTEAHADCPGHVAWIGSEWVYVDDTGTVVEFPDEPEDDEDPAWEAWDKTCEELRATARHRPWPTATYGCNQWRSEGHRDPYTANGGSKPKAADLSEEERAEAKKARTLVIQNNKEWAAAEPVRRDFVANLAKAKTAPKGAARFLAVALTRDETGTTSGNALAAEWLGKKNDGWGRVDLSPAKSATDAKCLLTALIVALGDYEAALTKDSWRHDGTHNAAGRYLRFLQAAGYTLSDVEQYALSDKTA